MSKKKQEEGEYFCPWCLQTFEDEEKFWNHGKRRDRPTPPVKGS